MQKRVVERANKKYYRELFYIRLSVSQEASVLSATSSLTRLARYSTVPYRTVSYGKVRYGTVRYGTAVRLQYINKRLFRLL